MRCRSQLFDGQVSWTLSAYIWCVEIHGVDHRKKHGLTFWHRACACCCTATKGPGQEHREPRWPTIQFSPVGSSWGFTDVGIESAHCCHGAPNSSRSSDSADAMLIGNMSPR